MRFSEREGFKPARAAFQINSVDEPLRNSLWNAVHEFVIDRILELDRLSSDQSFLRILWVDHFQWPIDEKPEDAEFCVADMRGGVFDGDWYEIYDLIEFCLENFEFYMHKNATEFSWRCNSWLEREMSAWRVVGNRIARLTSEEEIEAVEQAQASADEYGAVATHVRTSLELLSDRRSPDYRNSIKEAISAVESTCRIITKNPKATLGDALKQLERLEVKVHPALRGAFEKLYGYTSDQAGIRHALLTGSTLDYEDAKFMLVSCSAFVNLLKARAESCQPKAV